MVGISGTGKSGAKHYYYVCQGRRRTHTCKKENVRREWVETMVCRQVRQLVLQDPVVEWMADCVVDYQRRHRDDGTIQALVSQLKQTQGSIKNIMAAIEAGIFTASTKDRLLELEAQEAKLQRSIETEKALRPTFSRERVIFWLEQFRDGSLEDPDYLFRLVSTFVNAVYLYDDHVKIALNYSGRSSTVDLPLVENASNSGTFAGSYNVENGPPNSTDTNTAAMLYFLAPVFVLVIPLKKE
jgi:hypothetical protein